MRLRVYTQEDFTRDMCILCGFVHSVSHKQIAKGTPCEHCGESERGYTTFPNNQSAYILGGMIHFVDSYNQKIKSDRHIFPPQVYLPIIFATSNYETLLSSLIQDLMKKYGRYIGRLTHLMIYDEVLSPYDKRTNEKLFKALTGLSINEAIQAQFPNYFTNFGVISKVRNNVVHGKELDATEIALQVPNQAIDFLLESVGVFSYLNNHYVVNFETSIDYRRILRLGDHQTFEP